jgi:hypothetical protein
VNHTTLPQCNLKGGEECAPQILHVEPKKTYRIRIASTTSMASLNLAISVSFSISRHTIYVVLVIYRFHYFIIYLFLCVSFLSTFISFCQIPICFVCMCVSSIMHACHYYSKSYYIIIAYTFTYRHLGSCLIISFIIYLRFNIFSLFPLPAK